MFEEDDKKKRRQWQIFHLEKTAEKVNRMHKNLLSGNNKYLDDPPRNRCLICGSEDVEIKEFPRHEEIYKEVVKNGESIKQLVSVITEIFITYKCKNCGNVVRL